MIIWLNIYNLFNKLVISLSVLGILCKMLNMFKIIDKIFVLMYYLFI